MSDDVIFTTPIEKVITFFTIKVEVCLKKRLQLKYCRQFFFTLQIQNDMK
jgi:hypothetical protein